MLTAKVTEYLQYHRAAEERDKREDQAEKVDQLSQHLKRKREDYDQLERDYTIEQAKFLSATKEIAALRTLLASALSERDAARAELEDETKRREGLERRVDELISFATAARAREARLAEALKPFAQAYDECLTEGEAAMSHGCDHQSNHDEAPWEVPVRMLRMARAALAATDPSWLEVVRREAMQRMLNVAKGCHDYGGGYRTVIEQDLYHHGIQTVISALEGRMKDDRDTECNALEMMGRAELEGGRG